MKKSNLFFTIVFVIVLITLIGIATYAYFAGNANTNNVVNLNTLTEQNNMVFDTLGGEMILNVTLRMFMTTKGRN